MFSRDAASQYTSKPDKHDRIDRSQKLKTYMTESREASESVKCPACDEDHDLEGCQVYLNKSLEDISKFINNNKLCYECLRAISKDHNVQKFKNRRSCKKCHETTLHVLKIEKKTTSRDKTNNEINISTNNNLVQEGNESGEMFSYNSTYTASDFVSMCVVPVKVNYGSSSAVETYVKLDSCSEGTFIEKGLLKELKISG